MVKIVDFKVYEKEDGTEFCALIAQGGIESIKSKETGKVYLTVRKAIVPCTFNQSECETLIGMELEGHIDKVETEPYQYTVESTGEQITLTHRNEYVSKELDIVKNNVIEEEVL